MKGDPPPTLVSRHAPLVSAETTFEYLGRPDWVVFDCRYDLADKEKGLREYAKGHIQGAYYAHVDRDMSGPVGSGSKGRHPMPIPGAFQRFVAQHGITKETQVVCYDDAAGQWASRLWWLLRHHGLTNVAVLDGGLTRWKALRLPLSTTHEKARPPVAFNNPAGSMPTTDVAAIEKGGITLVDARASERFRGDVEPIDKRAGHIPGAINLPFAQNVGPDMRFLSPDELRAKFEAAGVPDATVQQSPAPVESPAPVTEEPSQPATRQKSASEIARTMTREERRMATAVRAAPAKVPPREVPQSKVACYCGSGVTSTQVVLAMEVAGLGTPALYPGSWSEWSFPDAKRPIVGPAVAVPDAPPQ